jgi:ABC-2 type transport system ATP-binding protein
VHPLGARYSERGASSLKNGKPYCVHYIPTYYYHNTLIHVSNITKKYSSFIAVNNLSFSIPKGIICGFLGINGAGKTTTIRMLCGIIEPTEGNIIIGGFDIKEKPLEAKKITGYIPDRPYLYPSMTPLEFLAFIGDLYEIPHKTARSREESLLSHYSLWDKRNELIQGFSHGMKQRLATCAALLHSPEILIIDEPMVGLDPHGAKTLKASLKEYAAEGMTIFLSTHSLNVAEELCDRIIIIHHGSILYQGSVMDIKNKTGESQGNRDLESVFIELTKHIP